MKTAYETYKDATNTVLRGEFKNITPAITKERKIFYQ